mmetsp:Transcript_25594/g.59132  ORF Transcript_25594/g.59132 Transcript_25594/m.59132 type:complete len:346 (+) Transcript_25594:395-1432(+)
MCLSSVCFDTHRVILSCSCGHNMAVLARAGIIARLRALCRTLFRSGICWRRCFTRVVLELSFSISNGREYAFKGTIQRSSRICIHGLRSRHCLLGLNTAPIQIPYLFFCVRLRITVAVMCISFTCVKNITPRVVELHVHTDTLLLRRQVGSQERLLQQQDRLLLLDESGLFILQSFCHPSLLSLLLKKLQFSFLGSLPRGHFLLLQGLDSLSRLRLEAVNLCFAIFELLLLLLLLQAGCLSLVRHPLIRRLLRRRLCQLLLLLFGLLGFQDFLLFSQFRFPFFRLSCLVRTFFHLCFPPGLPLLKLCLSRLKLSCLRLPLCFPLLHPRSRFLKLFLHATKAFLRF